MNVKKAELEMMMKEFWALSNNDHCENMTIIFLTNLGYDDEEIRQVLDLHYNEKLPSISHDDYKNYEETLEGY